MNFKNIINSTIRIIKIIKLKIFNKKKLKLITIFFSNNFDDYQVENPTSTVLIDPFTVPEWVITNSYFVNILLS